MGLHNQLVLGDLVSRNAKLFPDKIGIINYDTGLRLSFREFDNRSNQVANSLLELGLQKGDRVGLLQHNCHQFLEVMFGCFKAGLVLTPLNTRFAGAELAYILNNAKAAALIFGQEFIPTVESIREGLDAKRHYICIGNEPAEGYITYDKFYQSTDEEVKIEVFDDDLAVLPYTSGTTGKPKGVMITHRNQIAQITQGAMDLGIRPRSDTFLCVPPLFHAGIWAFFLPNIYLHGTTAIISKFDPETVFKTIEDLRVNSIFLVPAMILMMIENENVKKYDLSSLRNIYYGAAPIPPDRLKKAMDVFGCNFIQGYGMTETSPWVITLLNAEDHVLALNFAPYRLASCGRPSFNAVVRVVDEHDRDVGIDQVGEVLVRGPHVMKGYWKNPEANEEALRGGWFHTGDMVKADEDGFLYMVDRKKDMYISGGENVYPKEVEDVISSHPAVFEVAIIGVPDEKWGEVGKAFISLKPGMKVSEQEIKQFLNGKVARFKIPKYLEFVDEIPRNASGKILKINLRKGLGESK